jgi:hypothetical protein
LKTRAAQIFSILCCLNGKDPEQTEGYNAFLVMFAGTSFAFFRYLLVVLDCQLLLKKTRSCQILLVFTAMTNNSTVHSSPPDRKANLSHGFKPFINRDGMQTHPTKETVYYIH